MKDLLALDIANTPLAIIMLMELPEHVSLVADDDRTADQEGVTPTMLARTIALVESHCPASATLSSHEMHAAINEQLTMLEPMHELCARLLERQGGFDANIWIKAAVLSASRTFTGQQ